MLEKSMAEDLRSSWSKVGSMNPFQPPGSRLLRDPWDVRIEPSNAGEVVVVGVPWDWSTSGRPGARYAPSRLRDWIYRFTRHAPSSTDFKYSIADLGDVRVAPGDINVTSRRIVEAARIAYTRGKLVAFLGGDHSITRWTVEPLAENSLGLLVLDAHYDMRSVEEGLTSGSWLWDLWVAHKGRVKAVIVGVSDFNNPEYLAMRAMEAGFKVIPRLKLLESLQYALEAVDWLSEQGLENFYISIDVDHLDISHAPGVNSPTPLGMTPWESLRILEYAARKLKPRGVDVVEVTPQHDVAEVTVATTAKLLLYTIHNTILNTT